VRDSTRERRREGDAQDGGPTRGTADADGGAGERGGGPALRGLEADGAADPKRGAGRGGQRPGGAAGAGRGVARDRFRGARADTGADEGGPGGTASGDPAPAPGGGGPARGEHVLPILEPDSQDASAAFDGPLRGGGGRVRPVRFRSCRRPAPGRAQEADPLCRLPAEVLPVDRRGGGAG